jgi:hypothetical protein
MGHHRREVSGGTNAPLAPALPLAWRRGRIPPWLHAPRPLPSVIAGRVMEGGRRLRGQHEADRILGREGARIWRPPLQSSAAKAARATASRWRRGWPTREEAHHAAPGGEGRRGRYAPPWEEACRGQPGGGGGGTRGRLCGVID